MSAATETPQDHQIIDALSLEGSSSSMSPIPSNINSSEFKATATITNCRDENNDHTGNVLGFTQNLLDRILTSRSLLDNYVKVQRDAADGAVRKQAEVHEVAKEEIGLKIDELKSIQRRRGLSVLDENRIESCRDGTTRKNIGANDGTNDENDDDGLAQKHSILEKKLAEITRELADCSLEHQKLEKNVRGENLQYLLHGLFVLLLFIRSEPFVTK